MKNAGSSLIEDAFASAREDGSIVLIGFLTAGDPSPKYTLRLVDSLIQGGVDIMELGIPFSDPLADGPAIQAADVRALKAGSTPQSTLQIVKQQREKKGSESVPLVLLSYFNPIMKFGVERFLRSSSSSGVSGLVVPDLPADEGDGLVFSLACKENAIANIAMAAPSTSAQRLESIVSRTEGFLYLVSLLGVTGSRKASQKIDSSSLDFIRSTSKMARKRSKSVAVGFGISRPEQVKDVVNAGADGVIVGSSFVNLVASNSSDIDRACKLLTKYAHKLKSAARSDS